MQMKLFKTGMKVVLDFIKKRDKNISFWEVYSAAMLTIRLSVRYSLWVEEEKQDSGRMPGPKISP